MMHATKTTTGRAWAPGGHSLSFVGMFE